MIPNEAKEQTVKHIYVLKHPIDHTVCYIGQAADIYLRRISHQRTPYNAADNSRRAYWITSVLCETGAYPDMESIEQCADDQADLREKHWIQHYADMGCPLVNTTHHKQLIKMSKYDMKHLTEMRQNIIVKNPYLIGDEQYVTSKWHVFTPDVYEVFRHRVHSPEASEAATSVVKNDDYMSTKEHLFLFTKISGGDAYFGIVWHMIADIVRMNDDDSPIPIDTHRIEALTGITADMIHKSLMDKSHIGINIVWHDSLHITVDKMLLDECITMAYLGLLN